MYVDNLFGFDANEEHGHLRISSAFFEGYICDALEVCGSCRSEDHNAHFWMFYPERIKESVRTDSEVSISFYPNRSFLRSEILSVSFIV